MIRAVSGSKTIGSGRSIEAVSSSATTFEMSVLTWIGGEATQQSLQSPFLESGDFYSILRFVQINPSRLMTTTFGRYSNFL